MKLERLNSERNPFTDNLIEKNKEFNIYEPIFKFSAKVLKKRENSLFFSLRHRKIERVLSVIYKNNENRAE